MAISMRDKLAKMKLETEQSRKKLEKSSSEFEWRLKATPSTLLVAVMLNIANDNTDISVRVAFKIRNELAIRTDEVAKQFLLTF